MINLLFVSIAFPPKKDSECIQTAKYFKYLRQEEGFDITVITTSSPTLNMPTDDSLNEFDSGYKQKISIPVYENKYLNIINQKLGNPLRMFPDTKQSFHKKITNYFKKVKNTPDFIYSRSYPLSSSIAAYKAKKEYNVPWLMHMSDPWYLSPLHDYDNKQGLRHHEWEKTLLQTADFVSFTSKETISLYSSQYPEIREKFLYFPNVFDNDDMRSNYEIKFDNKLHIVYTGGITGNRGARPILEALKLIDNSIKNKIHITFIGEADRVNRALFRESNESCIVYKGAVSFSQAKIIQSEANILLLIDNHFDNDEKAVYFPSKLLDYMIAGKKIMAITTPKGTTDKALANLNAVSFAHSDSHQIAKFIEEAAIKFEQKDIFYFKNDKVLKEFEANYNVDRLVRLIKSNA